MKDVAKTGWETRPLGEVCKLINGRAYKKPELLDDGPYPVLRVGNFFTNNHWYFSDLELDEDKYCDDGDLLYAWSASFGPRIWKGGKVIYHYHIWKVLPSDRVDRDFLYYFFDWDKELIMKEQGAGATMIHVSKGSMEARAIPLPPLEEQQRIAAVLDEAFEGLARARAHAEANLQNARELFNAELEKVFDVELADEDRATFEDITKDTLIGLVRSKKEQGPEREYDYAKMNNIGNDDRFVGPVLDRVDCTPEEALRFELRRGDFLFNTRNSRELVGKSCVVEADFQRPTVFNNNVMRVRFDSEVNSRFVALAFKSKLAKTQLEAMKSGTTNVVAIYHKSLKKLTLPMPSLETQRTLVDRFEELDAAIQRLISSYSEQAEDTDDLRQCLLQKAFAGELT